MLWHDNKINSRMRNHLTTFWVILFLLWVTGEEPFPQVKKQLQLSLKLKLVFVGGQKFR